MKHVGSIIIATFATAWTQVFTDGSAENATKMEDVASTSDSQTSLPLL